MSEDHLPDALRRALDAAIDLLEAVQRERLANPMFTPEQEAELKERILHLGGRARADSEDRAQRLECLKLAVFRPQPADKPLESNQVMAMAERYFAYVASGAVPE